MRPILAVIFCEDFHQLSWQFFRFDRGLCIVVTGPVVADPESRAAHRAQFKRVERESCDAQQFLVKYGHWILLVIRDATLLRHAMPLLARESREISS